MNLKHLQWHLSRRLRFALMNLEMHVLPRPREKATCWIALPVRSSKPRR